MFESPGKPKPIIHILESGMKLFIFCFSKVLPLTLIDVFLSVLLHWWMPELNSPDPKILMAVVMNSPLYLFSYTVAIIILHTAIFYRISLLSTQSDKGNFDALLHGVKKLLPILLATWLYTLLVGLGLILLVFGVILSVSLRFFTPLIILEEVDVLNALQRSHQLVWGNWWRTTAILMVPLLISISGGVMLSGIVEGILMSSTTFSQDQISLLVQSAYIMVDKLLTPLFYAIMLIQYYDLKRCSALDKPLETHLLA